jgi:predicted transcriptional regulator of viral defense system
MDTITTLQPTLLEAESPSFDRETTKLRQSFSGLRPIEQAVLAQADRHDRAVLVLPDDADLLDQATGGRRQTERSLRALTQAGYLLRVRRGTFVVRTRAGTLNQGALALVGDITRQPHLVTGGVALARAGLSDQSFRTIIVLVATSPLRPWYWLGQSVRYHRVGEDAMWGGRIHSDSRSTRIARPTRALLDCLAHPNWGVTISEVALGIQRGMANPEFVDTLATDAARFDNALTSRRLGFLVEKLSGRAAARPLLPLRGRSKAIVPLVPTESTLDGPIDSTWRLRINVDIDLVLGDLITQ